MTLFPLNRSLVYCHLLLLLLGKISNGGATSATTSAAPVYSAFDDASWAITTSHVNNLLGQHVKPLYDNFIDRCQEAVNDFKKNSHQVCARDEDHRLQMNREQPTSVYNYTKAGYTKIKAPKELFDEIVKFYNANKGRDTKEWNHINTYHNMWETPPSIIHMNQRMNVGGGMDLQTKIWSMVKPILQEWTGQKLSPVSLYGIRIYHNNSILAPHVDRMPLVTSCIINVDQDIDEDWPLEVYGHDGVATNVTMEPGDMVLYESHSVIHGRPFPLKGRYYANVFVHFEPIGPLDPNEPDTYDPVEDIPPYLIAGSRWERQWRATNPNGWKGVKHDPVVAAKKGDTDILRALSKTNPGLLHSEDELGWRPLHEAVRAGHKEAVQLLILAGTHKDHLTKTGVSPLNIAYEYLEQGHEVIKLLESLGAQNIGPDL